MSGGATMTATEFLALPGDGWPRHELIEGELVVDQPRIEHQIVAGRLYFALEEWRRAGGGRGLVALPLDVLLDERNVYNPDVLWYAERPADAGPPYPVPDLAIEVRSPSTWRYDAGVKRRRYLEHGVRELWLVDGDRAVVTTATPSSTHEIRPPDVLESPLLPGFALDLVSLFARHLG